MHDTAGRFYIGGISTETSISYPHVRSAGQAPRLELHYSNGHNENVAGVVIAHLGAADGPVLCRAMLSPTGSWTKTGVTRCMLVLPTRAIGAEEDLSLHLTFSGPAGVELARLDALIILPSA